MEKVDYLKIIHKYIPPNSVLYNIYIVHVTLVTHKALQIARRLNLSEDSQRFIEEACMLHDIGIVKVNAKEIGCIGELPYIQHVTEGRLILESEGLPIHARVAENHISVGGLTKAEIKRKKLPLPQRDMLCETVEENIISYADLYFSKNPTNIWKKKSKSQVLEKVKSYGKRQEKLYAKWVKEFEAKKK